MPSGTVTPSGGGGGSQPGAAIVRKFAFAFNTASLAAGHTIYTPAAGDVILDLWVSVQTKWNGTTPFCDVGTAAGGAGSTGAFGAMMGPLDMLRNADGTTGPIGTLSRNVADFLTSQAVSMGTSFNSGLYHVVGADVNLIANATGNGESGVPAVCDGTPVKVWVTQDGTSGGADPGASQGAATVYLVTSTPT